MAERRQSIIAMIAARPATEQETRPADTFQRTYRQGPKAGVTETVRRPAQASSSGDERWGAARMARAGWGLLNHYTFKAPATAVGLINAAVPFQPVGGVEEARNTADEGIRDVASTKLGRDILAMGEAFAGNVVGIGTPMVVGRRSIYARTGGVPETVKLPGGEVKPVKPIPAVARAEEAYRREAGLPPGPASFTPFNPDAARRYARAFDEMPDAPHAAETRSAYEAMSRELMGQYRALRREGVTPSFMQHDAQGNVVDPYAKSPALLVRDLERGRMQVFPTEAGYGAGKGAAEAANPMLRPSGEVWDGKPALVNDIFRFVHDAYGHGQNPFFRHAGEERAYQLHASMFSPEARRALAAETRGQNSYVNFGPNADHNRAASGADTVFAPQKIGVMPSWATEAGLPKPDSVYRPFGRAPEIAAGAAVRAPFGQRAESERAKRNATDSTTTRRP